MRIGMLGVRARQFRGMIVRPGTARSFLYGDQSPGLTWSRGSVSIGEILGYAERPPLFGYFFI